jgi:hypothetical protein
MTKATIYAIYWIPASGQLQNGAATSMSAHYRNVQSALLSLYPGHGIDNNNTQYYSSSCAGFFCYTSYIQNGGGLGGTWVDTQNYPASGCVDSATPGNCLSDAQIQAEIQHALSVNPSWAAGINSIFMLFTSSGEGSCYGPYCAYAYYCGYHSYFTSGSTPVIYANLPYGDTAHCQAAGTPSPNGDAAADAAASVASHELTEAITDPELNAWYAVVGSDNWEIGDLCAYNYGSNTWDSGLANQSWAVSYASPSKDAFINNFELQQEFDNHIGGCVQVGP